MEFVREAAATPVSEFSQNYDDFEKMIDGLAKRARQSPRGIIVAYPNRAQWNMARAGKEWLPDRQRLQRLAQANDLLLVDLANVPGWSEGMYWDEVHPSPFGVSVMASILGDAVSGRVPGLKCAGPH
jgi:lysophospholipase L1-like esterase